MSATVAALLRWFGGVGVLLLVGFVGGCLHASRNAADDLAACRSDESAANRSLLGLVRAGNESAERGRTALQVERERNRATRDQVERLRRQIAQAQPVACVDAAARVRGELAP